MFVLLNDWQFILVVLFSFVVSVLLVVDVAFTHTKKSHICVWFTYMRLDSILFRRILSRVQPYSFR
mgnify:CR=1 FL=1